MNRLKIINCAALIICMYLYTIRINAQKIMGSLYKLVVIIFIKNSPTKGFLYRVYQYFVMGYQDITPTVLLYLLLNMPVLQ